MTVGVNMRRSTDRRSATTETEQPGEEDQSREGFGSALCQGQRAKRNRHRRRDGAQMASIAHDPNAHGLEYRRQSSGRQRYEDQPVGQGRTPACDLDRDQREKQYRRYVQKGALSAQTQCRQQRWPLVEAVTVSIGIGSSHPDLQLSGSKQVRRSRRDLQRRIRSNLITLPAVRVTMRVLPTGRTPRAVGIRSARRSTGRRRGQTVRFDGAGRFPSSAHGRARRAATRRCRGRGRGTVRNDEVATRRRPPPRYGVRCIWRAGRRGQ